MKGSYDGHQRGYLEVQFSSSAGIVSCGPAGRPFLFELGPFQNFGRRYGCGMAGHVKKGL
eukprot:1149047-Pelagomonas_calceolata.AAC.1